MSLSFRDAQGRLVTLTTEQSNELLYSAQRDADYGEDDQEEISALDFLRHHQIVLGDGGQIPPMMDAEIAAPEIDDRHRHGTTEAHEAPRFGELLLTLLVSPEAQEEKIGDFTERYRNAWAPTYGNAPAQAIYIWHALRVGLRLSAAVLISAAVGWFVRKLGS